jgi:plasmid maintenance system killer protein
MAGLHPTRLWSYHYSVSVRPCILGGWSIRVNERVRITFRFEDGDAHGVRCEDYH